MSQRVRGPCPTPAEIFRRAGRAEDPARPLVHTRPMANAQGPVRLRRPASGMWQGPRTVQAVAGLVERHGADQRCALWNDARRLSNERSMAHGRTRWGSAFRERSIAPIDRTTYVGPVQFSQLGLEGHQLGLRQRFLDPSSTPRAQRLKRVSGQGTKPQNSPSPCTFSFSLDLLLLPKPSP